MQLVKSRSLYREKHHKTAVNLLEKLTKFHSFSKETRSFHILIIGAGSFPSYSALLDQLCSLFPLIKEIHFILIEPIKVETDLFENYFFPKTQLKKRISVNYEIYHGGLQEFLEKPNEILFDIVYFEHPEMMAFPILLAKLRLGNTHIISMQESIPLLSRVFKPYTIIIASCMSKHELHQLKSLLKFSFYKIKIKSLTSFNPIHYFYGGPYHSGLITEINQAIMCPISQYKKTKMIQRSHFYLCLFMLFSFIIYCVRSSSPNYFIEQAISVFFMCAQLFLHKPGKNGLAIKLFLLASQITL